MRVGVVFESVVSVLRIGFFGSKFLQPGFIVTVKTGLVVVNENRRGYVHRVNERESFFYAAFGDAAAYIGSDVYKFSSFGCIEPEFFSV